MRHATLLVIPCLLALTTPLAAEPTATPERATLPALELAPVDEVPVTITQRPCEAGMRFEIEDTARQVERFRERHAWGEGELRDELSVSERHAVITIDTVDATGRIEGLTLGVERDRLTRGEVGAAPELIHDEPVHGQTYHVGLRSPVHVERDDDDAVVTDRERALVLSGARLAVCPTPWLTGLPDMAFEPGERGVPDAEAIMGVYARGLESPSLVYRGTREEDGARVAVFAVEYVLRQDNEGYEATSRRNGELVVDPESGALLAVRVQGDTDSAWSSTGRRVEARGASEWHFQARVVWPEP